MLNPSERLAQKIALGVPALLIAGAYISEYGFGLYPCEMCWWQRWPHFAAIALGLASYALPPKRLLIALAALAVVASGLIGGFHAGVEYHWWEGLTKCTGTVAADGDAMAAILDAPMVRCDAPQWTLFGISLAGFNFLISTVSGLAALALLGRKSGA